MFSRKKNTLSLDRWTILTVIANSFLATVNMIFLFSRIGVHAFAVLTQIKASFLVAFLFSIGFFLTAFFAPSMQRTPRKMRKIALIGYSFLGLALFVFVLLVAIKGHEVDMLRAEAMQQELINDISAGAQGLKRIVGNFFLGIKNLFKA